MRAHQLLALLYMDREDWERAQRELKKCVAVDRNNTMTLRYMKEVEEMLAPDESARMPGKRKKDDAVRYQSDNEIIIQPLNVKEQKNSGVSTLLNIGIGLVIGLATMYFMVVPAAVSNANNEAKQQYTELGNQLDAKTSRIQELENEAAGLQTQVDDLNKELQSYLGEEGALQTIDNLLIAATAYLETKDVQQTSENLEAIASGVKIEETSEAFQRLYHTLLGTIGPELSETYYDTGYTAYRSEDYPTAIENLSKAVYYDTANADALYQLAHAYRKSDEKENAIATYEKVIELFPDTEMARKAQQFIEELKAAQ